MASAESTQSGSAQSKSKRVINYLLRAFAVAFSGVLIYTSYQPSGLWWAAPAGFTLFFLAVNRKHAVSLAWLQGVVLYGLLLPWVGEYVGAIAWVGLALVQSLYSVLFGMGLRWLLGWHRLTQSFWFAPIVSAWFVTTEWIRSSWPFGGFGWGRIAWGQVGGPFASIVALGGPALVTFVVLLVSALVASLINIGLRAATRRGTKVRHAGYLPSLRPISHAVALVIIAAVSAFAYFSDAILPNPTREGQPQQINVAAIQGNVPRMGLDFNSQRRAVLDNHARQTGKLAEQVRAGTAPQPNLVLWPENASDINPYTNEDAQVILGSVQKAINAPILVGTVTHENNRMVVWTSQGPEETHDKRFLQPFGEYMPLRDFLRNFSDLVDQAGNFQPGAGNGLVNMVPEAGQWQGTNIPVGVATCYEVAFDEAFRTSVRAGAEILTTPTNNATFGFTDMTYQQLAMSRMRAIEYDRTVVVPATSGVSAIVDHDGRVIQQSSLFEPYTLQSTVELRKSLTISALVGPWVEWILCAVGAAFALAGLFISWRAPKPAKRSARKQRSH